MRRQEWEGLEQEWKETGETEGEDEDEEEPEIDETTLTVRLPDKYLYKLLGDKLKENACRNRGYVLDGFPRTYDDAQYCFLERKIEIDPETGEPIDEEEEEEELEPGQKKDFSKY